LEPQGGTGSGGEDVVMVPVDDGAAPPPPTREHDAAASVAPEPSAAGTATSIEGAEDMSMSRYLTIPGIGTIDLDATELPSNDREILEAVTERVFTNPSLLDTIMLGPPAPRQDGDAGGPASSAAPEAAEGVLEESAAGAESAAIVPPLLSTGENADAPLHQTAEAVVAAPPPLIAGAAEEVVGAAEPWSPQPAVAAEEVTAQSQPTTVPQEHDAPEGATRAASPEIHEARENSGAALPRDVGGSDVRVLELVGFSWAAAFEIGDVVEDDEEAVVCNTLERGLAWARRTFDELILPTMSLSLLCANDAFLISRVLPRCVAHL
jgi:hypothetical protein